MLYTSRNHPVFIFMMLSSDADSWFRILYSDLSKGVWRNKLSAESLNLKLFITFESSLISINKDQMIFKFLILSDEVDNFKREIKIDADATFLDFYKTILDCTGFSDKEMASFFLCDEKWRKMQEITLVEMDTYSDEDSFIMEECILSDYLEDEKQKLMYVFDYLTERALYIELSEIIPGKNLKAPLCTLTAGEAPRQIMDIEELKPVTTSLDLGETFYGDESFDPDELDKEGFEGLDDISIDNIEGDLF